MDTTNAPLIAFAGRGGSGKSAAADILVSMGYSRVKFADPLKNMLRTLYATLGIEDECIEESVEGRLKEEPCVILGGSTPRHAMQTLGTEWGRDCMGQDFWVNLWEAQVRSVQQIYGSPVVVDDLRFENEYEAVKALGGKVIRLEGHMKADSPDMSHVSEQYLVPADEHIANTGTLAQLHDAVLDAIQT